MSQSPARIVQPPEGHAIALGSSFRVVALLPRDAEGIQARFGRHDVTDRLREVRPGRYAGRIPTRLTGGAGLGFLLVTYRDGSGRQMLGRGVIIARRHQGAHKPPRGRLLSAGLASHRVAGVARLHLFAPRADQWSVRVNGRDVSARFADHAGLLADGALSASTNLHQGLNHVVVVAARDDGSRAVRRFKVRILPHTPIPDAGMFHRVAAGDAVRLGSPGGAAEPARHGDLLEHTWRIVGAPKRSEAKLRHPHSERPTFRPDVKGSYRITDQVTERTKAGELVGRSAPDPVEVAASPSYVPPIGEPIETLAAGPQGSVGVKFAGSLYPVENFREGTIQVMTIDPKTMATLNKTFDAPGEALAAIESEDTEAGTIVIVEGGRLPRERSWIEAISKQIGAPDNWAGPAGGGAPAFSVIGVKGTAAGQAWANAAAPIPHNGTSGALRGYIAPNYQLSISPESATYTFTPSTYFSYDTNTTGAGKGATEVTAKVGGEEVKGSVPSGRAGFLAAEFDAGTLALGAHQSFAITGGSEEEDANELGALAAWLEAREGNPGALVLVQSIGAVPNPHGGVSLLGSWGRAARAIDRLGGHENLFLSIGSPEHSAVGGGGYSFLGGGGLREAGVPAAENGTTFVTYLEPEVVRLAGLIQLGHLGTLVPAANTLIRTPGATAKSNPDEIGNFELPLIAYQNPTPWPYEPGSSNPDAAVVAAGHYISSKLCGSGCDDEIRQLYELREFEVAELVETKGFECPAGGGEWEGTSFTRANCATALAEFERESKWANRIESYFSTSNSGLLYPLSLLQSGKETASLEAIGNEIEQELNPPEQAQADISWVTIFESLATALEAVDPEGVAAVATEIDAGLTLAEGWGVTSSGESIFRVETEIDDAVEQVQLMVYDQQESIDNLRALIVTDYGKLSKLNADIDGTNKQWNLPDNWSPISEQMNFWMRGAFYRTFVPALSESRPAGEDQPAYRTVKFLQTICTKWSGEEGATVPNCGSEGNNEWKQVWNFSEEVCWNFHRDGWHPEGIGQELLENEGESEKVELGANAIMQLGYTPYYGSSPGSHWQGIGPIWYLASNPGESRHSWGLADVFPAATAKAMSGEPETSNHNGGLPPWELFELLAPFEPREPPIDKSEFWGCEWD
ncbi:MAG TPA: hypothetical protein VGH14_22170 [Solirubrobacterales bacterium]